MFFSRLINAVRSLFGDKYAFSMFARGLTDRHQEDPKLLNRSYLLGYTCGRRLERYTTEPIMGEAVSITFVTSGHPITIWFRRSARCVSVKAIEGCISRYLPGVKFSTYVTLNVPKSADIVVEL